MPEFQNVSRMTEIAPGLWECSQSLKVPGLKMDHRMTVARLASGAVWVHSPCAWTEELAAELRAIGEPFHFVAPSRFHDLYWDEWFRAFPGAVFYAAPGVAQDHRSWPFQRVLQEGANEPWEAEIGSYLVEGMPSINEFVFIHRTARTLILSDLVFNISPEGQNWLGGLFLKLNGIHGRAAVSRIFRRFIRDRAAFRESVLEVMAADFDRILAGHGAMIATGGKSVLRDAMGWLLDGR